MTGALKQFGDDVYIQYTKYIFFGVLAGREGQAGAFFSCLLLVCTHFFHGRNLDTLIMVFIDALYHSSPFPTYPRSLPPHRVHHVPDDMPNASKPPHGET